MHENEPTDPDGLKRKHVIKVVTILGSLIPLGISLTVLAFVWTSPFREFGSLPLFFRIFMSIIALGFMIPSIASAYIAMNGIDLVDQQLRKKGRPYDQHSPSGSQKRRIPSCPQCGAPVSDASEISPSGDVKCTHCRNWFNVRGDS